MAKLDEYKQFLSNNEMYLYRLEHNTFVVESMKLLYMDTPKTAGTSLKTKLAEAVADYIPPDHSDSLETVPEMFIHDRVINPLKPVTFYSEEEQNEILFSDLWKRVCVVRNPFNRIFSAWFSKLLLRQPGFTKNLPGYQLPQTVRGQKDIYLLFSEFIEYLNKFGCQSDPHWDLQTRLLFQNTISWGKVLRFETLQNELLENRQYFGGREIILDELNVSGFSPDWELVSSDTKELIRKIYKDDFSHYDYPLSPPALEADANTLVAYVNGVSARNSRLEILMDSNRQAKLEMVVLQREIEALRRDSQTLSRTLTEIKSELNSVLASQSWRVTKPFRTMMDLIRRVAHRK